jgi:hypothetical protein
MNATTSVPDRSVPWHLWVVGVLALSWNSVGAFDYVMTETRNASYMSSFTREQLDYFYGFPKWAIATWALGVWGGVLGSLLLLLRRRLAVVVFGVSLAGTAITFFYNYVLTNGLAIMGGAGVAVFSAVIILIAIALLFYARGLAARRVLR